MGGEEEAGVIIEEGEGINAFALDFNVTLEITLPEVIGIGTFEALIGGLLGGFRQDGSLAFEDIGNRANAREIGAVGLKKGVDFAWSPAELLADLENATYEIFVCPARAVERLGGVVDEGSVGTGTKTSEPFVASLATDVAATTSLGDGEIQRGDEMGEGQAKFRHGSNLPGHGTPPLEESVPSPKVLPMSLHRV